ncbi:hypothetical protein BC833DRAFT_600460 [Globomyces pollinis-pini]|nr:hypothetical protein BC833DRAFT_600460 [Globomyces pollinis-pini]
MHIKAPYLWGKSRKANAKIVVEQTLKIMDYQFDLKALSTAISAAPFSKSWSVIQLHDEITVFQLLSTLFEVATYVDAANVQSIFNLDRDFEEKIFRLWEFLRMLKMKEALVDTDQLRNDLMNQDRKALLCCLTFLLKDVALHKKRAYLALFLSVPQVPTDFSQDEVILDLTRQIEALQEEFKNTHKYLDGLKQNGPNATALKREIHQMEEEKQQLYSKVTRIQKKVQGVANSDQWLQAAKNLRTEQQNELALMERLKEQKSQVSSADHKYTSVIQSLKAIKSNLMNSSPDSIFAKMEEENRMNRFLAKENLPKMISDGETKIRDLNEILAQATINEEDLQKIEDEIADINQANVELAEQKLKLSNNGDANLALFRQQAAIIARKKEGALAKLPLVTEELNRLQAELQEKLDKNSNVGTKMLNGDEFKKYVSELRGKSTNFKRKKSEISSLTAEYGILERTFEILKKKEKELQAGIEIVERRNGVLGYHNAQANLEKVSEQKSEVDEEKGKKLDEISDIIKELVNTINEKKTMLAPVIQTLRAMRQEALEIETTYSEKKRIYDATMIGIDNETNALDNELKTLKLEIRNDQSKYHHLNQMLQQSEIAQDRVMNEMKAYIGADDMIELVQQARGFKTYRELYNRKIIEQENASKVLKEAQTEIKIKHEPNMKQIAMFSGVQKLLMMKINHNKEILSGRVSEDTVGVVTMDRLVLS